MKLLIAIQPSSKYFQQISISFNEADKKCSTKEENWKILLLYVQDVIDTLYKHRTAMAETYVKKKKSTVKNVL